MLRLAVSMFAMVVISIVIAWFILPILLTEMGETLFFTWLILIGIVVGVGATQISNMLVRQRTSVAISIRESAIRTVIYWFIMIVIAVTIIFALTMLKMNWSWIEQALERLT